MHLSDLHLLSGEPESDRIVASLVAAVGRERARRRRIDLVIVTGDLFDSGEVDPRSAARTFLGLHRDLQRALGPNATPTLIVPGNHDRRRMGLFGPHRDAIFSAIAEHAGPELFVHGARTPFLAAAVPRAFHGQPLDLLAYDSTYLPHGYLSAGGVRAQLRRASNSESRARSSELRVLPDRKSQARPPRSAVCSACP